MYVVKNKGAHCGYCTADLCLCKKQVFSWRGSNYLPIAFARKVEKAEKVN